MHIDIMSAHLDLVAMPSLTDLCLKGLAVFFKMPAVFKGITDSLETIGLRNFISICM